MSDYSIFVPVDTLTRLVDLPCLVLGLVHPHGSTQYALGSLSCVGGPQTLGTLYLKKRLQHKIEVNYKCR